MEMATSSPNMCNQPQGVVRLSSKAPASPGEVYSLGISVAEQAFKALAFMADSSTTPTVQSFLQEALNVNKKELADLKEWLNFELNCSYSVFYEAGGTSVPEHIKPTALSSISPRINHRLNEFYHEIDLHKSSPDPDNIKDVFQTCLQIRKESLMVFGDLAGIYPEGPIRNAFNNLTDIIGQGNARLSEVFLSLL